MAEIPLLSAIDIFLQTNIISMDIDTISTEHSSAEQHPHVDNQQGENLGQDSCETEKPVKVIQLSRKRPMHPTPLYTAFCLT